MTGCWLTADALDVIDLLNVLEGLDMVLDLGGLPVEFVEGESTEELDGVLSVECFEFEFDDVEESDDIDWPWETRVVESVDIKLELLWLRAEVRILEVGVALIDVLLITSVWLVELKTGVELLSLLLRVLVVAGVKT